MWHWEQWRRAEGCFSNLDHSGTSLVDAHKVLCLCAISGDSIFLEDQFIELVASDELVLMPAAVKCAKYYFCTG